jgi:hypothetical protein
MSTKGSMAGWIGFAAIAMLIIGGIDLFQGLIALLEDDYTRSRRRASSWST